MKRRGNGSERVDGVALRGRTQIDRRASRMRGDLIEREARAASYERGVAPISPQFLSMIYVVPQKGHS